MLFLDLLKLPSGLIRCFQDLVSEQQSDIKIDKIIEVLKDYTETNVFDVKTMDLPAVNIILETNDSGAALLDIENIIKNNFEELKCCIKIFNYLSVEHNKYYIVYTRSTIKLKDIFFKYLISKNTIQTSLPPDINTCYENDIISLKRPLPGIYENEQNELPNRLCFFIKHLFQYYFVSIKILENQVVSVEQFDIVKKNINIIIDKLSGVSKYTINHTLNKIIFNLVSVFHFAQQWLWSESERIENYTRFLQLIITELNDYGLAFCIPPNYDYMSLNNYEFELTEYDTKFNEEYNRLLKSLKENNKASLVNLDFNTFNEKYIQQLKNFACLNDVIMLSWEGQKPTIGDIILSLKSSILKPTFLFEFYDILYKSAISTVVYNTVVLLKNEIKSNLNFESLNVKQDYLSLDNFPETFKKCINELNSKLRSYFKREINPITKEELIELYAILMELDILVHNPDAILSTQLNNPFPYSGIKLILNTNTTTDYVKDFEITVQNINNLVFEVNNQLNILKDFLNV